MIYQPPFTITPEILNLLVEINELIRNKFAVSRNSMDLHLRRINQIKTIRGSLAIEGNQLSESQITAILDGKPVIAPAKEILEVQNAIRVYEKIQEFNPLIEKNMLQAHHLLMRGLIDEIGNYRSTGIGVYSKKELLHRAPPAKRVPLLMQDLFVWLQKTDLHPLIASSVFHYEFEFIHPFEDGNGRMGRLWQSLILGNWQKLFLYLPVENMIYQHQQQYYQAIQNSTDATDSSPFILFMLKTITQSLKQVLESTPQVTPHDTPQVEKLILLVKGWHSRRELQQMLGLKDRKSFQSLYLNPAINAQLIEMKFPEKPKSKNQAYRITELGKSLQNKLRGKRVSRNR